MLIYAGEIPTSAQLAQMLDNETNLLLNGGEEMSNNKEIDVLVIEPGKRPKVARIENTYQALQKMVGGYFEAIYPFEDCVALICNEEGKLNGLPCNRALLDDAGEIIDIIAGTFFICGLGDEDFCSLPDQLREKYFQRFWYPELFIRTKESLIVLPFDEE